MAKGLVSVIVSRHPRYSHQLTWTEGGRRRKGYANGAKAAGRMAAVIEERLRRVPDGGGEVTPEEWEGIVLARSAGVALLDAVRDGLAAGERRGRSVSVRELVEKRIQVARGAQLSRQYVEHLGALFREIVQVWGDRSVSDITVDDVASMIFRKASFKPRTLRNRRVVIFGLLELAVQRGWVERNVAGLVTTPRTKGTESIGVLTPEECRRYLLTAAVGFPEMLAGEAIAMFAGLRREEIGRLQWEQIDLARGIIEVGARQSKTRMRRIVEIQEPLAVILEQVRKASGPVWPPVNGHQQNLLRQAAGWAGRGGSGKRPEWPANALRHSFVSYHLAFFGDVAATEMQSGHDRKVMFQHYRELVTGEAAAEFWAVRLELPVTSARPGGR